MSFVAARAPKRPSVVSRASSVRSRSNPATAAVRRHFASTASTPLPQYLLKAPPTKITKLPSGLRVATEDGVGETATIGVYIDAGSSYENDKNNGTAHFLEHMAFKGTKTRSQNQIEVDVENMGAHLNAYTSREQTVYVARAFKNDVPKMLDLVADILKNSTLEQSAIERERGVILTEKEKVEENIEEVIFDYLHAAAFQGTPLARTILGDTKNIKSITRDDLSNYIKTHYIAPRMVVAAAGPVKHDEIVSLASSAFATFPTTTDFDYSHMGDIEYTGSQITVRDDVLHDTHVAIAFEGVSWSDSDFVTFNVLQALIGSWDRSQGVGNNSNSRLAEVVATENLMTQFSSFNTCYHRTGLFGVYFTAEYSRLDDACWQLFNEFQKIGKGLTEVELIRAKNRVKAAYLMQLDDTQAVCEDIGRQVLTLNRRMSPVEFFMRVDNVGVNDVKRVCEQYLDDVDPVVAAYGNLKYMPDYATLRGFTYWQRW